jgi:hypothetical protein
VGKEDEREQSKEQISIRVDPALLRRADEEAARRREENAPSPTRNGIVEEALRTHLGLLRGGAFFPTEAERDLIAVFRRLLGKNADAAEACQVLFYMCEQSEAIAHAVTQIAAGLETVHTGATRGAQGLPEVPSPRPQPAESGAGPRRRKRSAGDKGKE